MDIAFSKGSDGSTFGGYPLACVAGVSALGVLQEENLAKASEIQEKQYEFLLAKEHVNEVGNLDDTDVSLGYFLSTPETRVGSQITKIGVKQEFPWFGTLKAQKDVANAIAETKKFDIEYYSTISIT